MKSKVIEVGMFATVKDTKLSEYGVFKDSVVYVAGSFYEPQEEDPYNYRLKFVATFVKDGHIQHKERPFTVDGKRLEPVNKAKQSKYDAIKEVDFGDNGDAPEAG